MKTLILFEFSKFFQRKKNIITIVFLVLFIFIFAFANNKLDKSLQKNELYACDDTISSLQEQLSSLELTYKNKKLNTISELMDAIGEQLNDVKEKKKAIIEKDWKKQLKIEIKLDTELLRGINDKSIISTETPEVIQNRITRNNYLLNNKIKPINLNYSMTSYNFIRLSASSIVPLVLVIFIFLLTADAVSNEIDEGTYKILMTRSISRNKVIASKIIAHILICIGSITSIFMAFFIVLGIIKGFGSPQYPVLYDAGNFRFFSNGTSHETIMINIRSFVLLIIPIYILFQAAIVTIAILISVIAGSSAVAISSSIIIYIAIYILNPIMYQFSGLAQILPITYFNIPNILDGTAVTSYHNVNITYISGLISFGVTMLLCSALALLFFRKKDIL